MTKHDTTRLTPKLRFPEFRGGPGWEPKELGLALTFQAGFPFPSSGFNDAGKGLRLIRNRDLRSNDNIVFYSEIYDPAFVVSDGDILVGMDGDFSPCVWGQGLALLNQRVGRVTPRDRNSQRFLFYLLTIALKSTEEATARTTVKHLSHSAVEELHVPFPSLPEQHKVADCLASLDELIAAESRKLGALKAHKKGLMQQLFPREGETRPRLRFPEFRRMGEWEEKRIGDFGEVVTGNTPSTVHQEYYGGGIPFVSPADISDLRLVHETKTTLTALGFDQTRPIKANSVLFVCIGSTIGKVAQNVRDCATNQQINSVVPNTAHCAGFVYYLLNHHAERIARLAGKQAVPIINKSLFSSVRLAVPKEFPEQHRIASCLSSLDDLIAAQSDKVAALKTHKKGLMQQLFPSPEATGATQVSPLRPEEAGA